jgi:hypothetical protein
MIVQSRSGLMARSAYAFSKRVAQKARTGVPAVRQTDDRDQGSGIRHRFLV